MAQILKPTKSKCRAKLAQAAKEQILHLRFSSRPSRDTFVSSA
jgi:hypothetical protein